MNRQQPTLDWLHNPEVFAVNRLPAHSDHRYYITLQQARAQGPQPLQMSLHGTWSFSYAQDPHKRQKLFYEDSFDTSTWDSIQVPGHIQMQGYGHPHYTNTLYPWDGIHDIRPPHIPLHDNPVGSYRRFFTLPSTFQGKRIILDLEGVETACYVWVNGKFIGYGEDSFTPSYFDITKELREGENTIAIEVYRYSSASWLEDQDFWRFSGIFRDVQLFALPEIHVEDVYVKQCIDLDKKTAQLQIDMQCTPNASGSMHVWLEDACEHHVAQVSNIPVQDSVQVFMDIEKVHLWSAEIPYLYTLYIEIFDKQGHLIEVVPQKIGLRDIQIEDGIMKINGERIIFHGINRHEFQPQRGRSITKEDMEADIRLLKQHNVNAVRTSHYPNQSYWYELCDRYGMYLIDETNLESHGSWQKLGAIEPSWNIPGSLPEWTSCVLDRAKSMVERDKNHASILIWSCGNESYAGANILAIHDYFHEVDPSRIVHYEGVFWNREFDDASDIESRMYAKVEDIETYLKTNPKKPYISCEFSHAMGNSLGNLFEYVALEQKYPQYQGGFIWDYADQAIEIQHLGKKRWCYGGDFFDQPTDYNFCGDGVFLADRRETGKSQEMKQLYRFVDLLPDDQGVMIKNHYLFSNLSEYCFRYEVKKGDKVLQEGVLEEPIQPHSEKHIAIPWISCSEGGEYARNVYMHLKTDTSWGSHNIPLCYGQQLIQIQRKQTHTYELPRVVRGDGNVGIYGDNFAIMFMVQKGMVTLRYGDTDYLKRIPSPVFWRAPIDNELGMSQPMDNASWLSATLFTKVLYFDCQIEQDYVNVSYLYQLSQIEESLQIQYHVYGNGTIHVTMKLEKNQHRPILPAFGMNFTLPSEFQNISYYGRGPYDTYVDRMHARKDVYSTTPQVAYVPYLNPQECGNHCDVDWFEIRNHKSEGIRIAMLDTPMQISALPYASEEIMLATHSEELPPVYATHIRILMAQMGVGGDDSWGAPIHEAYHIDQSEDLVFHFSLSSLTQ